MSGGCTYRGRIAPTPTGYLHVGHAATFRRAAERCEAAGGTMVFRLEDLDLLRCKPEYCDAALEDLRWLGITWAEGPDVGGPCGPYRQSERRPHFLAAWRALRDGGWIYPCARSRREVATAALAPHEDEPVFPPEWRVPVERVREWANPAGTNWRFRVPDGEAVEFVDGHFGPTRRVAGVDFGDFLIWNRDNVPAYELAVVVDDIAMGITEVVRGADLLTSTARQLLLYRALGEAAPGFYHCPLVVDEHGRRLAKRTGALALRTLREQGETPQKIWGKTGF